MMSDQSPRNPNVGPGPVEAEPNHVREKTYRPADPPKDVEDEGKRLPEATAEEKVRTDMPAAIDKVKKAL